MSYSGHVCFCNNNPWSITLVLSETTIFSFLSGPMRLSVKWNNISMLTGCLSQQEVLVPPARSAASFTRWCNLFYSRVSKMPVNRGVFLCAACILNELTFTVLNIFTYCIYCIFRIVLDKILLCKVFLFHSCWFSSLYKQLFTDRNL